MKTNNIYLKLDYLIYSFTSIAIFRTIYNCKTIGDARWVKYAL